MAKYLWKVSYSVDALRGLMKEGAANRETFIDKLIANLGGHMESFYFAFGETDVFVIADLPDDKTAAAMALSVGSSGAANIQTVKLLSPEEVDAARGIETGYRPPGA